MNRSIERSFNAWRLTPLPLSCQRGVSFLIAFLTLTLLSGNAQEKPKPLIAKSSNLSSAMSTGDWAKVESSVDRGLEWLAGQQQDDGRFPSEDSIQPAITSLAVMAFLSRGHIPDHGRYGSKLSKAIDFVLDRKSVV